MLKDLFQKIMRQNASDSLYYFADCDDVLRYQELSPLGLQLNYNDCVNQGR